MKWTGLQHNRIHPVLEIVTVVEPDKPAPLIIPETVKSKVFFKKRGLIRVFLQDDTLHWLEDLNASLTLLVLQQQQNQGAKIWYQ